MSYYILNADNQPVRVGDLLTWGRWFEEASKTWRRQTSYTKIRDVVISTVFLGVDHSFTNGELVRTFMDLMNVEPTDLEASL